MLLLFCVFVVMEAGFVFSVAVGRMHCACQDEQWGSGGVGAWWVWMQETGKRKCQVLGGWDRVEK